LRGLTPTNKLYISKKHKINTNPDLGLVLQHNILGRLFFKFKVSSSKLNKRQPLKFENIGVLRYGFNNYYDIFLKYFNDCDFINYKRLANICSKLSIIEATDIFSHISTVAKTHFSKIVPVKEWIKICDLSSLYGYPKPHDRIGTSNVRRWLCIDDIKLSKDKVAEIETDMKLILGPSNKGSFPYNSLSDYALARQNWMNDGASKHSDLYVEDELIKTKIGVALSKNDKQILKLISKKQILKDGFHTSIKNDEKTTKRRYIMNAPIGLYIKQKYLLAKLLFLLYNIDPILYAYAIKNGGIASIQSELRNKELIPLDVKEFDVNISSQWYQIFKIVMLQYMPEEQTLIDEVFSYIGSMKVYDENNVFVGIWKKGVPSGMYWTSFLNSLINACVQYGLCRSNKHIYPFRALGDDTLLKYDVVYRNEQYNNEIIEQHTQLLKYISKFYKFHYGMVVHIAKNWFTSGMTEFTKMIITELDVFQYPTRAYASMVYFWPDSRNNNFIEMLTSVSSIIKEYYDRIGIVDMVYFKTLLFETTKTKAHIHDKSPLKYSKKFLDYWLHTPTAYGGFGLLPLDFTFTFKHKTTNILLKNNAIYDYPIFKNIYNYTTVYLTDKYRMINTIPLKFQSIYEYYNKRRITFQEFLNFEKLKLENAHTSIRNTKGLIFGERNNVSYLPYRQFFKSDNYILRKHKINFKGLNTKFIKLLRFMQTRDITLNEYHPQLEK